MTPCPSTLHNGTGFLFGGGTIKHSDGSTISGTIRCELERFHKGDHQFTYGGEVTTWQLSRLEWYERYMRSIYELWSRAGAPGTLDMRVKNASGDTFLRMVKEIPEVLG